MARKKKQRNNSNKNDEGEDYEEELKGGDDDMEVDEGSYVSMKSMNRINMLPKNRKNVEDRKSLNKIEKE